MLRRVECTVPTALAVERQSQPHHSKSYALQGFFLQILSFIIFAINTLKLLKRSEIIMFCHFSVCFISEGCLSYWRGGGGREHVRNSAGTCSFRMYIRSDSQEATDSASPDVRFLREGLRLL